jgi:hypothetical protein
MVSLILHLSLKVQNDDNREQTGLSWKPTPAIAHQEVDISPAKSVLSQLKLSSECSQ